MHHDRRWRMLMTSFCTGMSASKQRCRDVVAPMLLPTQLKSSQRSHRQQSSHVWKLSISVLLSSLLSPALVSCKHFRTEIDLLLPVLGVIFARTVIVDLLISVTFCAKFFRHLFRRDEVVKVSTSGTTSSHTQPRLFLGILMIFHIRRAFLSHSPF